MKKFFLAVAIAFLLGACLPLSSQGVPTARVDVAATSAANVMESAAQTLTAQPTSTSIPPTETMVPTLTSESFPSSTSTTIPATTVPETATEMTSTFVVATSTDALTTVSVGSASATPTLGILTYGTLPPAIVPFTQVTLINRSKRQAYISLQVVTEQGGPTIIEYPVKGTVKVKAPVGYYVYVAWVGGKEMVGEFRLHNGEDLTITLYRDKIVVK